MLIPNWDILFYFFFEVEFIHNVSGVQQSCCCSVSKSCTTLCDPMGYITHQVPLPEGFPREEYCSGLPFLSPTK